MVKKPYLYSFGYMPQNECIEVIELSNLTKPFHNKVYDWS